MGVGGLSHLCYSEKFLRFQCKLGQEGIGKPCGQKMATAFPASHKSPSFRSALGPGKLWADKWLD